MAARKTTKSAKVFRRAKRRIPGGVNSPVRAFGSVGVSPPPFIAANSATRARTGMLARSSNNSMAIARCPCGAALSPESSSIFITAAVEDSTKPIAAISAVCQGQPNSKPTIVSSPAMMATCAAPRPKMSRRSAHNFAGRISSPMTNRNITTPNSPTCKIVCASVMTPSPNGPMARPAAR